MLNCYLYCNNKYYFTSLRMYLEPCQTSMMKLFCENSKGLEAVNCFRRKTPSHMFERFLITPLAVSFSFTVNEITWRYYALLDLSFSFILTKITWRYRNSPSQIFFKVGVLKNFANFTGKHLRWSLFLIRL